MKSRIILAAAVSFAAAIICSCGNTSRVKSASETASAASSEPKDSSIVYVTRDLSAEGIVKMYRALGRPATGRVALKISTGPVALDQACYDIVTKIHNDEHNNTKPLLNRIARQHGTHITEWGEQIGLGSTAYKLIDVE